jgi:hypothetical protein
MSFLEEEKKMERAYIPAISPKDLLRRYRRRVVLLHRDPFRFSEKPQPKIDWWALLSECSQK